MAEKLFDGQHEDEVVISVFRRHPVVLRKGLIAILVLMTLGLLPAAILLEYKYFWFEALGFGLGLLIFFYAWIGWYFSIFIITDQRFIKISQQGFFNKSVVDIGLGKIQNINYEVAGIQQTLLGFGTIAIQTFVGDLVLYNIHHPARVQELLIRTIKDNGYTLQSQENVQEAS